MLRCLKSTATWLFIQRFAQTNIITSHNWPLREKSAVDLWISFTKGQSGPLWKKFIGHRWIPLTPASTAQKVSMSWHHHVIYVVDNRYIAGQYKKTSAHSTTATHLQHWSQNAHIWTSRQFWKLWYIYIHSTPIALANDWQQHIKFSLYIGIYDYKQFKGQFIYI